MSASQRNRSDAGVLTMTRPDDWHLHLRDGPALEHLVADSAKRFSRAIIMPNLRPPVTTTEMALAYRERILEHVPAGLDFNPLMTLYLTEKTSTQEIARAAECGHVHAIKLYPAGATTNSDAGVRDLESVTEVLHAMQDFALPLLVHGEVVDPTVDVFDREQVFIERHLGPLSERFPDLRIVFEHITTEQAVGFVTRASPNVAATITAHHLLLNRNALFDGGLRPHHYCLPVVKRERHRVALLAAATGDSTRFFLGTDSAPHARHTKETACGCAGIYTSHAAIELYAEAFAGAGALDKLERFAAFNGPAFYGLAPNTQTITLRRRVWEVPDELRMADQCLVPFRAGERISWTLDE